jgi:hypothetical protein
LSGPTEDKQRCELGLEAGERKGSKGTDVCIHAMKEYRGSGGSGSLNLNFGISWSEWSAPQPVCKLERRGKSLVPAGIPTQDRQIYSPISIHPARCWFPREIVNSYHTSG